MERHPVNNFLHVWKNFVKEDKGATAIEYALIASILGVALLPVLSNTTSGVASLYVRVQGYFDIVNGT
jgi:Flp pilus assembly pilin Flp